MVTKVISLFIDETSIRLLVSRGNKIKKWANLPLEAGLIKNNVVINEAEVAAKIKQLLKAQKVRAKKISLGFSGLHCLTRPISLPPLPKTMLDEAVAREARRVLPTPTEQLYLSWQSIPSPDGKNQVFVAGIPCKTADSMLKTALKAGLKPTSLDIKPLALSRMVKEATAIIVDVQMTEFDIVIMSDGVPQPVRTVSFPEDTFSWQQKLPLIEEELDRTIKFFNSSNPQKSLSREVPLYLSGDAANEPEMNKALTDKFSFPVLKLSPPFKPSSQFDANSYMVNLGLSLNGAGSEVSASLVQLNSLPAPYRATPISWLRIVAVPSAVAVMALMAVLLLSLQNASAGVNSINERLSNSNQILNKKQLDKKELTKTIAELDKQVTALRNVRDTLLSARISLDMQDVEVNRNLTTITGLLPSYPVVLKNINYGRNDLSMRGWAEDEEGILSFSRALDDSGQFSQITISSVVKGSQGKGYDFTLMLKTGGKK